MFEHYTDGDVFDATMEPGWAPLSVSGLAQWGPKATAEFTGTNDPRVVVRRSRPCGTRATRSTCARCAA
jgi:hypothetical protein